MSKIKMHEVRLDAVKKGGYRIGYKGHPPSGAALSLGVEGSSMGFDVTGRPSGDLLGPDNLKRFLVCIGMGKHWGKRVRCRLQVRISGRLVDEVFSIPFDAPVRPYVGPLSPSAVGLGGKGPKLQYTGNGRGRMLHFPDMDGCYYFTWGGRFVTDDRMRGYDCTTYAGAVFGVEASSGAMSGYGTRLANHLVSRRIGLEGVKGPVVQAYFKTRPYGTFLLWSDSHVVVVHHAVVHEFSQSRKGYVRTPVADWRFGKKDWWVRQPMKQFD